MNRRSFFGAFVGAAAGVFTAKEIELVKDLRSLYPSMVINYDKREPVDTSEIERIRAEFERQYQGRCHDVRILPPGMKVFNVVEKL